MFCNEDMVIMNIDNVELANNYYTKQCQSYIWKAENQSGLSHQKVCGLPETHKNGLKIHTPLRRIAWKFEYSESSETHFARTPSLGECKLGVSYSPLWFSVVHLKWKDSAWCVSPTSQYPFSHQSSFNILCGSWKEKRFHSLFIWEIG